MRVIYLDAGHGPDTAGKRTPVFTKGPYKGDQIREHQFNKAVAKEFFSLAIAEGYTVVPVYSDTYDVPLSGRSSTANAHYKAEVNDRTKAIFLSWHFNAYDGKWGTNKGGNETHHHPGSTQGMLAAQKIQAAINPVHNLNGQALINRGVKASNFHVLRETYMPAVLIEAGFMDVYEEALLMLDPGFIKFMSARALVGVELYFDEVDPGGSVDKPVNSVDNPIQAHNSATLSQMKQWSEDRGATEEFISLAEIFFRIGTEKGADGAGAYAQSAKETAFGKFGGVIDASYCNPCGLKVTEGGGNYDPGAHKRFKDWDEGITAMIDHLLLYAGAPGYPLKDTPDPRHFTWIKGKAPTFEELGGKWAPNPEYGNSIVKNYLEPMRATEIIIDEPTVEDLKNEIGVLEYEIRTLKQANRALKSQNEDLVKDLETARALAENILELANDIKNL